MNPDKMYPGTNYPDWWPQCVNCIRPALDGHLTCGHVECDEDAALEAEFKREVKNDPARFVPLDEPPPRNEVRELYLACRRDRRPT